MLGKNAKKVSIIHSYSVRTVKWKEENSLLYVIAWHLSVCQTTAVHLHYQVSKAWVSCAHEFDYLHCTVLTQDLHWHVNPGCYWAVRRGPHPTIVLRKGNNCINIIIRLHVHCDIPRLSLNKTNTVIGWFLVTWPWSNSNVSRPGYNSAVVARSGGFAAIVAVKV